MRSKKGKSATTLAAIVGLIICFIFGLLFVLWPFHKTHPQDSDVVIASFSSDSKKILAGTREGMAYLWNVDDQRLLGFTCVSKSAIDRSPAPFNSLALAPQGQFIVVAGSTLALLTIASSREPAPKIWAPDLAFGGAAVSPEGSHISAVSSMEQLLLWLPADSPMPRELGPVDAGVYGATAFSPNGDRIISAGHTLRMLDVKTGMELWRNSRNSYPFLSVSFRHDGNVIVTGSQDTSISIWNAQTGIEIARLKGHNSYVDAVDFSPSGSKLVSWTRDGQLFLWDLSSSMQKHTLLGLTTGGAAFSPDGRWIASGGTANTVLLWDATTQAKARVFSPDSQPQFSQENLSCK